MDHRPAVTESPQSPVAESPEGPAGRDELRALRRWVLVAGIWAAAATAVALIALLDSSKGNAEQRALNAERRAAAVEERLVKNDREQRGLSTRIGEVESRVGTLAPLSDVSKLQDRVGRAEENASEASDKVGNSSDKVKALEDRVAALEDAPAADAGADQKP